MFNYKTKFAGNVVKIWEIYFISHVIIVLYVNNVTLKIKYAKFVEIKSLQQLKYLNLEFIIMIIAKANNIFYLYNLNLNM
jgi:hypothetical protein